MVTIRSFIALEIPNNIISQIRQVQNDLKTHDFKAHDIKIRWSRPENIHLTLRFLGDIDESQIFMAKNAIKVSSTKYTPLTLSAKRIGVFPNIKRPNVLWIGLGGQIDILSAIQKELNKNLERSGFNIEKRPFKGHLTLGRIKGRKLPGLFGDVINQYNDFKTEDFICREVVLFNSDLKPTGPVYNRLFSVEL